MSGDWVLGVDIGGTNLVVGAVLRAGGAPLALRTEPTEAKRGADAAVERIVGMANAVIAAVRASEGGSEGAPSGMGIGCPGPLDLPAGVVLGSPNLGWRDYPIRDRLSDRLGLVATLDNDANCATYGEWWQGAGRGVDSLIGVTLGTGVGGGIIVDGRLVRGASGCAGEIGHVTIDVDGRACACGSRGCLEAYASGPSIAARALEGLRGGAASSIRDLVGGDLTRVTAKTVYDAIGMGDSYAVGVMSETAVLLGTGLANLIATLNPAMIVIVGGVTGAGEHLFGPLRSAVEQRAFPSAVRACRIVPGELPDTAGVVGAAGVFLAEGRAAG